MALVTKNLPVNAGDLREVGSFGKIPWRRALPPTPVFVPGESQDRGAWGAAVHGAEKSQTRLKNLASMHTPHCRVHGLIRQANVHE